MGGLAKWIRHFVRGSADNVEPCGSSYMTENPDSLEPGLRLSIEVCRALMEVCLIGLSRRPPFALRLRRGVPEVLRAFAGLEAALSAARRGFENLELVLQVAG